MPKPSLAALAVFVLGLTLAFPAASHAQAIWGGEVERGLRPGAYVPYDGVGWMQRYNYETGPGFYLGIDPYRIANLVYQDRVNRAVEIGPIYQAPWNPYGKVPLFNRLLGRTAVIVGPIPTPEPPSPHPLQFQIGTGVWIMP